VKKEEKKENNTFPLLVLLAVSPVCLLFLAPFWTRMVGLGLGEDVNEFTEFLEPRKKRRPNKSNPFIPNRNRVPIEASNRYLRATE